MQAKAPLLPVSFPALPTLAFTLPLMSFSVLSCPALPALSFGLINERVDEKRREGVYPKEVWRVGNGGEGEDGLYLKQKMMK